MNDIYDVIEAFADGERVDPGELDRALADREGRSHLIDMLVLRGFANGPGLSGHVPINAPPVAATVPARVTARSLRWLSIAALVTIVASIGGYVAGERRAKSIDLSAANISTDHAAPAIAAPVPTQVIRFEPGVDWTEHGGH